MFCAEHRPQIKGGHPGLSIGDAAKKLGAMWTKAAADDRHPCEKMAAKLKEKHKKPTAAYEAKAEPGAAKRGGQAGKSKRKRGEEEEEEDDA